MRALYTAATGMTAQELNVQVISNNIANMRTTGYKRQRAQFQDLLYETLRRPGAATSDRTRMVPSGVADRLRRQDRLDRPRHDPGHADARRRSNTTSPCAAKASSACRCPTAAPPTPATARSSSTRPGQLVTHDGYIVDPAITIPQQRHRASRSAPAGQVAGAARRPDRAAALGQIQLARFINKVGLESIGDNLYVETAASGQAVTGAPGVGRLRLAAAGLSWRKRNVNAVTEISSLIAAQRAYEMNARVITASDQMLSSTTQMFRG